ncbi:leucine-rich repeat-containing protein 40-like [Ischnura elegans]|uniref:leucine-rich repeat-containing protein 40-like n=1 Tax=Ischnura elegans TaxID=197161 RepID=UPI001ED8BD5A|nr:leucine-rich repeat-containing protein 40-like [Ischnura elegans]
MKVQRMPGDPKRSGFNVSMGQRYFCFVIIVISITGCPSEKSSPDSEDGGMNGFHCKEDPRCLCFEVRDMGFYEIFCEDKVLVSRWILMDTTLRYVMMCNAQSEVDPYHYLSMIIFSNFSSYNYTVANNAHLMVFGCTPPSSNQTVLLGDWSSGSIGGWRDLPLEKLTIYCEDSKTLHFSMRHWSALEKLKELTINCPKLPMLDEDLLSRIPKRLERLTITDTGIRHLPESFFSEIESLKTLDLRQNKLRSLKRNFLSSMRNLEELYLCENGIESIDDDFFLETENLTRLDLEKNSLKTLPTSICRLKKLEVLHAEYNRIRFIPEECLYSLQSLHSFTIPGNELVTLGLTSVGRTVTNYKRMSSDTNFPNSSLIHEHSGKFNKAWIRWSSIRHLYLENNSLSSLPDEAFHGMVNLEHLNISSNNIAYLPVNIFSRNKNLTVLLASNNLFTNIPAALLRNKSRLFKLDLSYNLIETLDLDFFSDTSSLCYVHINNNRFRHLPDKIFQQFKTQNQSCEEFFLDMSGNRLEDVPELSIPGLTHLNLSKNRLTLIKPDMFTQAPRLLEVNLSHNLIHTIENPLELDEYKVLFSKHLINLTIIDLSSNRLTVYPSISPILTTLKHLNLSGNYITEFAFEPEIRRTLSPDLSLETFDVSRNRLKSVEFFKHWIWDSAKTKHVDLSHNLIDLRECIAQTHKERFVWGCLSPLHKLTALEVIILSHNQIDYIPMEFQHFLPNLRYVDLSHNKIKRLWYGDLLFTRARDGMDLEPFRMKYIEKYYWMAFFDNFPGSRNLTIDLRHNSIASLQLPDDKIKVVIPGCDIDSKFSRVKLLLGHNPFVCDCEVFKLLRYASKEMRPTSALERLTGHMLVVPAVIDIQDLHCSKPDSVNGKEIADVESWAYHWLPMIGFC